MLFFALFLFIPYAYLTIYFVYSKYFILYLFCFIYEIPTILLPNYQAIFFTLTNFAVVVILVLKNNYFVYFHLLNH